MDEGTPSPYFTVSPDDHAGWLVIATIVFFIYSLMGVVGKVLLRASYTTIRSPDYILIGSLALLLMETVFIVLSCKNGLGRRSATLDPTQFDNFAKYYYAATILALIIQVATKLSINILISVLSPDKSLLLANRVVMGVTIAWGLSGIFSVGFACGVPTPWRNDGDGICTARRSVQIYNGIMNIVTDLAICILPIVMMWDVKTTLRRKIQVCSLFGCRILVPCLTIPALATSNYFYGNIATDPTWYAVAPAILFQIALNLSVLTACVPGLKSILENLVSGMTLARVQNDYDLTRSDDRKSSFGMTPRHTNSNNQSRNRTDSKQNNSGRGFGRLRLGGSQHSASITGGEAANSTHGRSKSDADKSVSDSTRNLTEGVIIRTDHYEVSSIKRRSGPSEDFHFRQSREDHDEIMQAESRA